jgi:hypothetical protein
MECSIETDNNTRVCVIRVSGTIRRPADSLALLRTAGVAAEEHEISRILFDLREATPVGTTMAAYETVVDPEKHGVSRLLRIAVVYSVITKNEQFMENVGVNRGSPSFRVFDNVDVAREWVAQ